MTVRLTSRAERDLRKLDARQRTAVVDALRRLDQGAANVDVKALRGTPGWLRLRIGDYRALFRPIEGDWLVDRIVDHRELDRAVRTLP